MFNNQYSHLEMFWVAADINCYNGLDYHIQISERFNPARDIVDQFTVAWEDIASLDFILAQKDEEVFNKGWVGNTCKWDWFEYQVSCSREAEDRIYIQAHFPEAEQTTSIRGKAKSYKGVAKAIQMLLEG
jgi:hypothetical protein